MAATEERNKSALAKELGVSRSSLYYRPKKLDKDEALRREIERVMLKNHGYGSPRVAIALKIYQKCAARVMKKFGLRPARRSKKPYKPADQGRESLARPCVLSTLSPIAPDVVWASDFTFICYRDSFVYLCTVIDVFAGEVLGFNISRTHDAHFVLLATKQAVERTETVTEWLHSDQGSEYASNRVQSFLKSRGVTISMNPNSSPWCNGSQESFFGRFKVEFGGGRPLRNLRRAPGGALSADLLFHLREDQDKAPNVSSRVPARLDRTAISVCHNNPQLFTGYEPPPRPLPPLRGGGTAATADCIMSV